MPEHINLLDKNEMLKLLKGEYSVRRVKRSQFDHEPMNVPTEVSVVLVDYIYKAPHCKRVFQEALKVLFSGSAGDVFLGFDYVDECLLDDMDWYYYPNSNQINYNNSLKAWANSKGVKVIDLYSYISNSSTITVVPTDGIHYLPQPTTELWNLILGYLQ